MKRSSAVLAGLYLLLGLLLIPVLSLHSPGPASGHALDPGYLEIAPVAAGDSYRVFWRRPDVPRPADGD